MGLLFNVACLLKEAKQAVKMVLIQPVEHLAVVLIPTVEGQARLVHGPSDDSIPFFLVTFKPVKILQKSSMSGLEQRKRRVFSGYKNTENHRQFFHFHPCSTEIHLNHFREFSSSIKGTVTDQQRTVRKRHHRLIIRTG